MFEDNNITFNSHHNGVDPTLYETNAGLKEMWEATSISYGEDGRPFVATIEGKNYPFYGT